jgi:Zn-dependent M28 family amino/carboxypeptidase
MIASLATLLALAPWQAPEPVACAPGTPTSPPIVVDAARLLADVATLAADSMAGRQAGTDGGRRARAWLVRRVRALDLDSLPGGVERPFALRRGGEGANLVFARRGTLQPARWLVVTAHYDHLGVRDGQVYNGADDNASGVAALLAMAEHVRTASPQHSILFALLDGEESGLQGAAALLASPPVPVATMAANLNLDMVGRSVRRELFAVGPLQRTWLQPFVRRAACRTPVRLMLGHDAGWPPGDDWTSQSDHARFDAAGIPFVYLGVEDHPDYHRPTDDVRGIDASFLAGAAQAAIALLDALDAGIDAAAPER